MFNFESDYTEGCIPEILEALQSTNTEQTGGYGMDPHCDHARALIKKAFGCENADVHFLVGGTQANMTVISSILRPHQGVLCAESGHINCHETGAVEATGHKCLALPSEDGTITAAQVEEAIVRQRDDESYEHIVQPGMVYISFPTETGTLYSKKQLSALYKVCRKYGLPLFIDGARLGYGLASASNDLKPKDIAKLCDVFYVGGTKVGALFGEAVVIVSDDLKKDFRYHIKQRGGMLAKGRLLGIQFEELFKENRYFKISRHAMDMAEQLRKAFEEKGYQFAYRPETNQLFVVLSNTQIKKLRKSFAFHTMGIIDETHSAARFVTSFMTTQEGVDALIKAL
ncbi:MAG: aminotransferase class V-fold PLP-dependent enzyme [Solobacterium sp.]|nr:aminotransferase class V-fold PLP-dependent enzyme [Solobacterium sp.]